jgi:pimeloyl-ACP methyl ester carboxylesterase
LNSSQSLTVLGRKLEYLRAEPRNATPDMPAIVLLHEGLGSVTLWKDFPHILAAATGTTVVAYSRFGYGSSDAAPRPYAPLEMHRREALDVLPEVLRCLGISRPILFGHSDGASIALIYGAAAQKAVSGLVVLAPHVFVEDMCLNSISRARETYLATDMRQRLRKYHDDPDRAFWLWNNVWLDPAFRSWNIEHVLPELDCPVLAIQGWQDEYGTMEQLDRLARAIPQAEQLRLSDCGHSPHRDQPAAVLETIAHWIRRSVLGGPRSSAALNSTMGGENDLTGTLHQQNRRNTRAR